MKAAWRGRIIAESAQTIEVDGYQYFPRANVRMELLSPSPKSADDLECPHGVQFFDVAGDGARSARTAWSYEAPKESLVKVDHMIGFWRDVEIAK